MAELTDCERVIMQVLWHHGSLTAQGIEQALSNRFANSTVRTFLRILEQKGHVAHRKNGRTFVYQALTGHDEAAREALTLLLNRFFNGSADQLQEWLAAGGTAGPDRAARRDRPGASAPPASKPPAPSGRSTSDHDVWLL
jgi:predicted transcriptional regulator